VRVVGTSLMGAEVPALGERGNPVHARQERSDVPPGCRSSTLAVRLVDVAQLVDAVVAGPTIGHDRRTWLDACRYEGVERCRRSIGEDRYATSAGSLRLLALDCNADQDLLALLAPASQTRLLPAEVGLVHFDGAAQSVPSRTHEHRAQPVQHRPRRRIGADLE